MARPSQRLAALAAQVCAGMAKPPAVVSYEVPKPGDHKEGLLPLADWEDSGRLLPDNRKRRQLPYLEYGKLDVEATRVKYETERVKRVEATKKFDTGPSGRSDQFPKLA